MKGDDSLLRVVVLCGGSAQLAGMRELGKQVFEMPLRIGQPGDLLGLVDQLTSPAYATSVGLLKWGVSGSLSPRRRRRSRGPGIGRRLVGWLRNFLPG